MSRVTIDNLDIKVHERYAQDQLQLDNKYITESQAIGRQTDFAATSSIYSSQWEILFGTHLVNVSWAFFCEPPKYNAQRNRFFTHALCPIDMQDDQGEKDKEDEEEEENELVQKVIQAEKFKESDKAAILNLFESMKLLNGILAFINAKKLQYQKG